MPHSDSGFVVREVPMGGAPHLELRRLEPAGARWVIALERGTPLVALDVSQAAALAGDAWWDVLQATKGELEHWDPAGTWRGSLARKHAGEDPAVVALWRGWVETWELLRDDREELPRARVQPVELPRVFAEARELDDPSVRLTVTGHGRGPAHVATIRAVLEEAVGRWRLDAVAVVDSPRAYVQLMDRKERPSFYVEASDPEAQEFGVLTAPQRRQLVELGWSDPKVDAMPYPEASYASEWSGANFAREWPRDADLGEVAAVLERTLAVYGLAETDDLDVELFPAAT
jgi:hypothetical protein